MMVTMASAYPACQQVHGKPPPPLPPPKPKKKVKFLNSVNKESKKGDKNHGHGVGGRHQHHHHQQQQNQHSHHHRHRQQHPQQQPAADILEGEKSDGAANDAAHSEVRLEDGGNSAQVRQSPVNEAEAVVPAEEPAIARSPVNAVQSTSPQPLSARASTEEKSGEAPEKPKPKILPKPAKKGHGWARVRKHLIVQEDADAGASDGLATSGNEKPGAAAATAGAAAAEMEGVAVNVPPRRRGMGKMWDAVLFQLFSARAEQQRRKQQQEQREKEGAHGVGTGHRAYKGRLPLLLFGPRFDARKLREAASRPAKKLTAFVFDLGLSRRAAAAACDGGAAVAAATAAATADKTFNRSARGWQNEEAVTPTTNE